MYRLLQREKNIRGVVAASAGNHAQGVAYAASVFGIRCCIVMPETASISKVEATRSYGAEVVLYGRVYDEAEAKAREIALEHGYSFIHAFNDIEVIAGQATIAWELIEQLNDFDMVVVPIGGGGLASGILSVLKKVKPNVKVIGVEPSAAPKMLESIKAGKPVTIQVKPSLADGLVTKRPGDITFEIVSNLIDDIVVVDENEIALAIYLLLERAKVLAEGAGAASLAALISGKIVTERKKVVALITGGNIDLTSLYRIIVRGLAVYGRIARLTVVLPDFPGTLRDVLEVIAKYRGNIVDIRHDRMATDVPWHARVEIVVEVPRKEVIEEIAKELRFRGYVVEKYSFED